ncbi:unnamed protein product, partial [Polarella glacialis]
AWQFCMAVRCFGKEELPHPCPSGLQPLQPEAIARMQELCGGCLDDGLEPTELAAAAAHHLLQASADEAASAGVTLRWPEATEELVRSSGDDEESRRRAVLRWLADRLDDIAHRISRNGFQLIRPVADGLFHRISYMNHCC